MYNFSLQTPSYLKLRLLLDDLVSANLIGQSFRTLSIYGIFNFDLILIMNICLLQKNILLHSDPPKYVINHILGHKENSRCIEIHAVLCR